MTLFKVLAALSVTACAQQSFAQQNNMALVQGKIIVKNMPADIALYAVANGETVLHSKVAVDANGNFGFYFAPAYSGFYRIGERKLPVRLYLAPGKQTSVTITDSSFSVAAGDAENKKMEEWSRVIGKLKNANSLGGNFTYKEIFPELPAMEKAKNAFVAGIKTGNARFNQLLKGMAEADFEYEVYHFLFMPRTAHPTLEQHPEIYARLAAGPHFTSTACLNYDFGQQSIGNYLMYLSMAIRKPGMPPQPDQLQQLCLSHVANDTVKGWFLLNNYLLRAKAFDQAYRDKVEKYSPYLLTDVQKQKLHAFELTIRAYAQGEAAIDFEGKTTGGKSVSLKDLKGKVVLVDVWATWCGPCRAELPHLKKLEEEMEGKNVVFVSYSIDEMKDLDKWKNKIVTDTLGGTQLIGEAAWKSAICSNYKITGIPRFMVFDKDGKIVSTDSPRPSNPALKELLEKQLR